MLACNVPPAHAALPLHTPTHGICPAITGLAAPPTVLPIPPVLLPDTVV